jgi:PKD domain
MSGKRRVTGLVALTASAAVLGLGGVVLAATAQGEEIPGGPAPTGSTSATSLPTVLPPSAPIPSTTVKPPPPSTTGTPAKPATPPPGPNEPPDAVYTLGSDVIWPGQVQTLKQTYLEDDHTPLAGLTQTISWGDGTTQTVIGTTKLVTHRYATVGAYQVQVMVSDGPLSVRAQLNRSTFSVQDYKSRFELEAPSGWVGKPVVVLHSSAADAQTVQISWGDGAVSNVKATVAYSKATHAYAKPGVYRVTAVPVNKAGAPTPRQTLKVTVKADGVKPFATLKKPAAPRRASRGRPSAEPPSTRRPASGTWRSP